MKKIIDDVLGYIKSTIPGCIHVEVREYKTLFDFGTYMYLSFDNEIMANEARANFLDCGKYSTLDMEHDSFSFNWRFSVKIG